MDVMCYFQNRGTNESENLRIFFPKGSVAKAQCIEDKRSTLSEEITNKVVSVIRASLISRFAKLDSLGKVYVDSAMGYYNIPFGTRSASKALNVLTRGSKIDMNLKADTIRFFLWWKDCENGDTVDIDLSAVFYDESWNSTDRVSYTQLRASNITAHHSGDITSAPNGACEFIDIDVNSVLASGSRYVIMNVYSYSSQPFINLPECFAGWMSRKSPQSGEIFEPKTVEQKYDLSTDSKISIPVVFDCLERKVVWTDVAMREGGARRGGRNVESNLTSVTLMAKAMVELKKPTMLDLLNLHVEARGERVDDMEEADVVFSPGIGILPEDYPLT
jgi:hypothetical protein